MKFQGKRLAAMALTLALAVSGSFTAMADTIVAGESRQSVEMVGPGVSRPSGSASQAAPAAQQVGPSASAPSGNSDSSAPAASVNENASAAVQLPVNQMPVINATEAQNAVQGAVTVNADYGSQGEILRVGMNLNGIKGTITYGVYVNTAGFIPWQADGVLNGGTEDSTHVEAIQVALTGDAGKLYDVYYRGVSAKAGQHGWARNEELMGTIDRGDFLKNIEVVLVPKGSAAPGSYQGRFYSNHSEYINVNAGGSTYANGYTGWVDHDQARYYFQNGQAVTGWQYIDGMKFFFNQSGALIMDVDDMIGKQDNYIIKVNKTLNCATVYAKDGANGYIIPVKSMLTSVGDDTPIGTFYTPEKYRWRFMINDTWTQYATRITEGFLFHSITYETTSEDSLFNHGYNRLGVTRSHGCVRLNCRNAKWVYDNCKLGTEVQIYEDAVKPGPFFKPYQKWIPEDQRWDPTDPKFADR